MILVLTHYCGKESGHFGGMTNAVPFGIGTSVLTITTYMEKKLLCTGNGEKKKITGTMI